MTGVVTAAAAGPSTIGVTLPVTPVCTYVGSATFPAVATSCTYSAAPVGTPDANRVAVAVVTLNGEGTVTISSVTIGGVAATQAVYTQGSTVTHAAQGIYYASLPTGTTADVVVTPSAAVGYYVGVDVYTITGGAVSFVSGTSTTTPGDRWDATYSVTTPAAGVAIFGVAGADNYAIDTNLITWSGATKDLYTHPGNYMNRSVAHLATPEALTSFPVVVDSTNNAVSTFGHGHTQAVFQVNTGTYIARLPRASDATRISFTTEGSTFAPMITTTGSQLIVWQFSDGSVSAIGAPSKNFGSSSQRKHTLYVKPWSALTDINVGYDAADGGTNTIPLLTQQNVSAVSGLQLAKTSLKTWASNYNPITQLDFSNFSAITDIECYGCSSLTSINLTGTSAVKRVAVEGGRLTSLDLSQSPLLEDLRGAVQTSASYHINWGATGTHSWHVCIRDNPQFTGDLPLPQLTAVSQLWIWGMGLSGTLTPNSNFLTSVLAHYNNYTSANFSGRFAAGTNAQLQMDHNQLTSINIDNCPGLSWVILQNNNFNQAAVDYILATLDSYNTNNGTLNIAVNSVPSATGITHANNLTARGWTITRD